MSLLAVPEMLPTLVRRPGLTDWVVYNNQNVAVPYPSTAEEPVDADAEAEPETEAAPDAEPTSAAPDAYRKKAKKLPLTLWPNGKEAERGMQHCLRIYPHLQDTGAFFVAVMIKAGELAPPEAVVEISTHTLE